MIVPGVGFWRAGKPHLAIAAQLALLPLPVVAFIYSFAPHKTVWRLIYAVLVYAGETFVQAASGSLAARKPVARWPAVMGFALSVVALNVVSSRVVGSRIAPYNSGSQGMNPTLVSGDQFYALSDRTRYPLERGAVIVYRVQERRFDIVQRIVGVEGDVVAWDGETLSINGTLLRKGACEPEEPTGCHTEELGRRRWRVITQSTPTFELSGNWEVPQGHLFALGDNRDNSLDSRSTGAVPIDDVKGVAQVIHFSWPTLSRTGRLLDPAP